MKKVLFIVALVAASFAGTAQTSKSTWMLGGDAGFASKESVTSWNVSPNIGYFVMDNLAIGANIDLKDDESGSTTNFGPFVRYYFTSLGKSAKLYGNAGANFGDETTFKGAVGVAYFLNSSVALETAAYYENNTDAKTSEYGLKIGFQIHFKK